MVTLVLIILVGILIAVVGSHPDVTSAVTALSKIPGGEQTITTTDDGEFRHELTYYVEDDNLHFDIWIGWNDP